MTVTNTSWEPGSEAGPLPTELDLDEGAELEQVLEAMKGRVVAWGELIGTSEWV